MMDLISSRAHLEYQALIRRLDQFPIHFALDERPFTGFSSCFFQLLESRDDQKKKTLILRYSDTLHVRLETAFDPEYGAYEWTAWFENPGRENSPVISQLRAQQTFEGEKPRLRGIMGDQLNYYKPYSFDLSEPVYFSSILGRATHISFPYFNLEHGNGGTFIALGWGGTWDAKFEHENGKTSFRASSTLSLRTYLKPGEKIRTALFAYLCYEGRDEAAASNAWRKWIVERNLPRANAQGDAIAPFTAQDGCDKSYLERIHQAGIRLDYNWIDIGWFAAADGSHMTADNSQEWLLGSQSGSWEVDDARRDDGLTYRQFIDLAHENGVKTLVWFEPERITHAEDLQRRFGYHPQWALPLGFVDHGSFLNNLGDDECLEWTYGRIRQALDQMNADMYREDFNAMPADGFRNGDSLEGENRNGITENKLMVNHYRLWDRIIADQGRRGKTTFIDSCASGGGRNDLETLRRSVPLLRSDRDRTSSSLRLSITSSLSKWLPFSGASTKETEKELDTCGSAVNTYIARASYLPKFHLPPDEALKNSGLDDAFTKVCVDEWEQIAPFMLKDYYLLTPWHAPLEKDRWTVWEYFDPAVDSGVLQAFRMEECEEENCKVCIKGLKSDGMYDILDADHAGNGRLGLSGEDLMNGITLELAAPKTSALLFIQPHRSI